MRLRPLTAADVELLERATVENVNWEREQVTLDQVRAASELAHYTRFLPERGDFGLVTERGGEPVGVAWAIFLPADDPGYGFVDDAVPELALWVRADVRGRGVGRSLLRALKDTAAARGCAALSLSVEDGNHARHLYESEGFVDVPGREAEGVMLWRAASESPRRAGVGRRSHNAGETSPRRDPHERGVIMGKLEGRIALVTGGASGIGAATVRRFAEEGAFVYVADVQDEKGEEIAASLGDGKGAFVHLDVTDSSAWQELAARITSEKGKLDVFFNNAGIGDLDSISDESDETYLKTIAVTQHGMYYGMRYLHEVLKASGNASVINTSSIFGITGGFGSSPAYAAAKGAVRILTKNAALAWAKEGIRVNSIHPGFIETPILGDFDRSPLAEMHPIGRIGKPEEIAAVVAFLASDDASLMTGSEVVADGGYTAR